MAAGPEYNYTIVKEINLKAGALLSDRKYTAFCGLYCKDCIPSNKSLFESIDTLITKLNEVNFSEYAKLKAKGSKILEQYPSFFEVLNEIKKLKCNTPCHEGPDSELGCRPDCEIRRCARSQNYEGCWECSFYEMCEKLLPLKKHHPGLEFNLNMIKTYGPDNWSNYRYQGKHYKF